ncbi:MAG: hypothetical protein JWM34_3466 [Ilumatobacteraceae bacterium]|nr:hypothetical protein [Ilumatobacteraceae bacterium]
MDNETTAGEPTPEERIAALEAALAELSANSAAPSRGDARSSRRTVLRIAGAAAVATAAAAFGSTDEAAAAGAINSGVFNTATTQTALILTGTNAGYGFGVIDQNLTTVPLALGFPAVLGHGAGANFNTGVGGYSANGGTAVAGQSDGGTGGGVGVFGYGVGQTSIGVEGKGEGDDAIGVSGIGTGKRATGVQGKSDAIGVTGIGSTSGSVGTSVGVVGLAGGSGVVGTGYNGVVGTGTLGVVGFGLANDAMSFGVAAIGHGGALRLGTFGSASPPLRTNAAVASVLEPDDANGLWWCVADGTPGTWRQISGPDTAGAFHAITPTRVYDSRMPVPAPGALAGGKNRTVSVADGRDIQNGNVTVKDLIPTGTTAITCNLAVVETAGAGYLTLNPGGNTTVGAASINWYTGGQILNNGIVAAIAPDRTVTVIAGGDGNALTHFIIDITGYYR